MVYNKYMNEIMQNNKNISGNITTINQLYPEIYNNIHPLIVEKIKSLNLNSNINLEHITKEEIEKISNDIYFKADSQNSNKNFRTRKYIPQIRNIALRDLIWIILVQEMLKLNSASLQTNNTNYNIY